MSTRNFPGGKGGQCVGLTTSLPSCAECHEKSESLNLLEPSGPHRAFFTFLNKECKFQDTHLLAVFYEVKEEFLENRAREGNYPLHGYWECSLLCCHFVHQQFNVVCFVTNPDLCSKTSASIISLIRVYRLPPDWFTISFLVS